MPTFNNDVRIVESDLTLENAADEEIVRIDQGGSITVRRPSGACSPTRGRSTPPPPECGWDQPETLESCDRQ
jgi:hypothetical protein